MPKMNARRSATCSLLGLRGGGLGVVRLHRHRRHDDRFFGLGLLGVGARRRRFGGRFGLGHRAGLRRLCARRRECFACRPARLWRRPLPSLPAQLSRRRRGRFARRGFSFAGAARQQRLPLSPRAAAIISATLSFAPAPGSSRRAWQSLALRPVRAAADQRRQPRLASAGTRFGCAGAAPPLASALRAAASISATVIFFLSAIVPPLMPRPGTHRVRGSLGGRSASACDTAAANREPCDRPRPVTPAIRCAATGYRNRRGAAGQGIVTFFTIFLPTCLWLSRTCCQRRARFPILPTTARILIVRARSCGKDQIVHDRVVTMGIDRSRAIRSQWP